MTIDGDLQPIEVPKPALSLALRDGASDLFISTPRGNGSLRQFLEPYQQHWMTNAARVVTSKPRRSNP